MKISTKIWREWLLTFTQLTCLQEETAAIHKQQEEERRLRREAAEDAENARLNAEDNSRSRRNRATAAPGDSTASTSKISAASTKAHSKTASKNASQVKSGWVGMEKMRKSLT